MRITGGQMRGRILAGPKDARIRPTSDQVKEAIFNIIGHDLSGFLVLDLFAGSGSLGLEALSRGSSRVVFVDKAKQSVDLIKKNLAICGFESAGIVLKRDLLKGLSGITLPGKKAFDLVFLDPPYGKNLVQFILKELAKGEILAPMAQIVAESSKNDRTPSYPGGHVEMKKNRIYGDTKISLYINEDKK